MSSSYTLVTGGHTGSATGNTITYTTTPSTSLFAYSFPSQGDWSQYIFIDAVNVKMYRVNLLIGVGYLNNFISIERVVG